MRRLRHPNVIQFVEVYETDDQLMVVMEYAPGKELFDVRQLIEALYIILISIYPYMASLWFLVMGR